MQQDLLEISNNTTTPWFKTKAFKIGVVILAIIAVIAVVLFSAQIGELLEFFGLRAAPEAKSIILDGIDAGIGNGHAYFFENGYITDPAPPAAPFKVVENRLMLN